jgi:predicted peroxiredoxin
MAKLVVSITFAKDNPDKATVGMVVANAGIASGQETIAFFSSEGVRLGKKGYADDIHEEGFAPLKELFDSFIENGGTLWFCAPCCKKRGIVEEDLVANSTIVGGAKLVEVLSQGAACVSY